MESWYAIVVGILTVVLVVPIVLYYGFGVSLPMPSIR